MKLTASPVGANCIFTPLARTPTWLLCEVRPTVPCDGANHRIHLAPRWSPLPRPIKSSCQLDPRDHFILSAQHAQDHGCSGRSLFYRGRRTCWVGTDHRPIIHQLRRHRAGGRTGRRGRHGMWPRFFQTAFPAHHIGKESTGSSFQATSKTHHLQRR